MTAPVLRREFGPLPLGVTILLLSCGPRLPTPYPSPTPRVAPPPSPEPTRCPQPREWRPPAGKNSADTRDLPTLQGAVPFPLQAPTYLPDGFTLDHATYGEYVDGTWDVAIYYARLPSATQSGGLTTVYYNRSGETILEYLAARLANACGLREVSVGGHAGYTFWDAGTGGEPAVLIWQDGDLKVSIWLELGDIHSTADHPHILDNLLLQMADSMRPVSSNADDVPYRASTLTAPCLCVILCIQAFTRSQLIRRGGICATIGRRFSGQFPAAAAGAPERKQ